MLMRVRAGPKGLSGGGLGPCPFGPSCSQISCGDGRQTVIRAIDHKNALLLGELVFRQR